MLQNVIPGRKKQSSYYKDHVTKRGKNIVQDVKKAFGDDVDDLLNKAMEGDGATLRMLGERLRRGEIALELLPLVEQALTTHYDATAQFNKTKANVLKSGSKNALAIKKARVDVGLANQRHQHENKEIALRYSLGKKSEIQRHTYAMGFERLKAFVAHSMTKTEQAVNVQKTINQPAIKQAKSDGERTMEVAKHLLENGEKSRVDLLPRKVYEVPGSKENQPTWFGKLKTFVGMN
ncbi:MAG: hypothetical protein KME25_32970 [Symplocastrum torsivum CPER-KK1]|jgi:hypothetical protein|uniref:Uncharacterized protein n=1 Tax=Symplocastrum torsivum CPER-KK1 TaxID=450513 RepID=A0A951UEV0_9CYAN|nr:hypothetical protein [Symplocastrum torsivum CPER-KK1]